MNALELMERLGGEVLANKIRVRIEGEIVVIGYLDDTGEWVYTTEGQELADTHSDEVAVETEAKPMRTRKSKDAPTEPVAVESADVEPEL